MTRRGASAGPRAERFIQVSVSGLLASAYLAILGSEAAGLPAAVAAGFAVAAAIAAVRLFGERWRWLYAVVSLVAAAGMVLAAVLSVSLSFFFYLAACLLFLVAALAGAEIRRCLRGPVRVAGGPLPAFARRLALLSLLVSGGILLLTGTLFFVLPRTAHVAFSRFAIERYRVPGFAGQVRLGEIGPVLRRDTPVMHVRVVEPGGELPPRWRGMTLSHFDGRVWRAGEDSARAIPVEGERAILASDDQRRRVGARVTYEVLLEPISSDVLFFVGIPEVLWIGEPVVTVTEAGACRLGRVPRKRLRYGAISYLDEVEQGPSPGDGRYLQLPPIDPRIVELARRASAVATTDESRAFAVAQYLRRNYAYAVDLPAAESPDQVEEFLFERRRGHCEYFASSMAVMLRTLGIPSRLVTGFQGGPVNPLSGWRLIRASSAHTWVEAWIAGRGWMSFDPTPPAAPRRSRFARLLLYADAVEMFWQDWIVGYDLDRQALLAYRMGASGRALGERSLDRARRVAWTAATAGRSLLRSYWIPLLSISLALAAAWFGGSRLLAAWRTRLRLKAARRGGAVASDATLLYERMLTLLERRGVRKAPWLTPSEFAAGLPPSPLAEVVAELTAYYHAFRYGGSKNAAPRMAALLEQLARL